MAPHTAHSRSAGQILQHTAIVLAGMASIGLTVAAGTYIVNQIGTDLPAVIGAGKPATDHPPRSEPDPFGATAPITGPATADWVPAAESRRLPIAVPARVDSAPVGPAPTSTATTLRPTGVGGRLKLSDEAYVGANLARTQQNSLTVTFDTNLPSTFGTTDYPTPEHNTSPVGVTEFRTDVDVHSGEFSVAMTDPLLGRHDVQVQRHARPAPLEDQPQQPVERADIPAGHAAVPAAPGTPDSTPA